MAATSCCNQQVQPADTTKRKHEASASSATADTTTEDGSATAAERVRYHPARTVTAVSSALLEAGASPEEVEQCMAALPQASPAPAPVPATLLLAFAAYWLLTAALGLGDHSAVYAMVGLIPLVLNLPHIVVAVYCMHFPVDKQHMMAAGSGIVWPMKNLAARFIGADNKIINTVCCTGHFLLLLLEYLPYSLMPITDIHPFVNSARGGGYHSSDAAHRQALLSMVNLWLSNGAVVFRVASRAAAVGVLDTLAGLMLNSKHYDILVDVGGHFVRLHVFTSINRPDGSATPVHMFVIGTQHLSMFRFPWVGLSIIYAEVRASITLLLRTSAALL
jgi:hypothetical protein